MNTKSALDTRVSPSVEYVTGMIASRILSGEYPAGRWLPSEREIAEEFHVSRNVVKSVVRELEVRSLVHCSSRCRTVVTGLADRQAGSRNGNARPKRHTLGLWIWPMTDYPSTAAVVTGINRTLKHEEYRLMVTGATAPSWADAARSESTFLMRMADDEDLCGLILWCIGGAQSLPALQTLRHRQIPLVFIDRRPPAGFTADYVGIDNEWAAFEITTHLIAQGHRRIAHISNLDSASPVAERLNGYRMALKQAGIPEDLALIKQLEDPSSSDDLECKQLLAELAACSDAPTAIFAVSDFAALRAISALRANNVRVGEDVAVAGFDGIERWHTGARTLTTACQPFEKIGIQALRLLMKRIENPSPGASTDVLLEAPIEVSSSTRP